MMEKMMRMEGEEVRGRRTKRTNSGRGGRHEHGRGGERSNGKGGKGRTNGGDNDGGHGVGGATDQHHQPMMMKEQWRMKQEVANQTERRRCKDEGDGTAAAGTARKTTTTMHLDNNGTGKRRSPTDGLSTRATVIGGPVTHAANKVGNRPPPPRRAHCAPPLVFPLPFFILPLLLLLLLCLSFAQQCPPLQAPCRCAPSVYEPVAIICENAGSLQDALHAAVPAKQFPIDSLSILDTAIPSLPTGAFSDWTILRLVLNRNTLSQVEEGAFDGIPLDSLAELDLSDNSLANIGTKPGGICQLRTLRKLYLNRNGIAQLSPQLFASFASREVLQKLELRGNKLTDQSLGGDGTAGSDGIGVGQSGVFGALKNLQELSLETNGLSTVPSAALSAQRGTLTNLNLGLNQIKEVPVGALNFPELTSLSLEFNGLPMIAPQAFQHVPRLQYLYLTGNKFPAWAPDMFRFIGDLRTLGIGETPISVIPANAFIHTPNLMRLEMSEAAVDTIEPGAFQRTPMIQAIVLNKNRLTRVRADMFQGLQELYSLDLQGNRLEAVEPRGFANLPALRHLDISFNLLQTLPMDTFDGTFSPTTDDRRVIYACENPWMCDSQLEWFRQLLRDNLDIDIDKPGCVAACGPGMECPPEGTPLRAVDFCPSQEGLPPPMPLAGTALSLVGWIILIAIMTVLLISICLMALLRYGMSHRRKKMKEQEIEDEQRIMSSAASAYQQPHGLASTLPRRTYATIGGGGGTYGTGSATGFGSPIELDLPPAHNLDDRPNYFM